MSPARLAVSSLALAALACGTRGTLFTEALAPLPLVATESALVQVVPQTRRAVIVTPGDRVPAALRLGPGARVAARVPGADAVAILTGTPRAPRLEIVDVATREVQALDAPGFFDAVRFSPDGRFGVLVYLATASTSSLVARNLNEIGLWAVGRPEVVRLQLDTESLAPRGVVFAPAEPNRQLVAVTLERGVALFDALHPEVAPRRVSIRPPGSTAERTVLDAVFSADARWLFLRASALDDVIAVELGTEVGAPVSASINFVAGGLGLADIAAAPAGIADAVLAVYATSREAFLLDARGIQDNAKRLGLVEPASRLRVLDGTRVLLWDDRGRTVAAWDVTDGRSGSVALDTTFGAPVVVPTLGKALFPHASAAPGSRGAALSSVTVVDETNRLRLRLQGLQLAQPLLASTVDGDATRLFFSVASSPAVVTMDLRTMQLAELPLDTQPTALFHVPSGDWLVADHGGPLGDVTIVPAGTTDRAGALRYTNFALTGDLDRVEDAP